MTAYLGAQRWKPAVLQDLVFLQRGFDITRAQQKAGDVPVFSSGGLSSWHNASKATEIKIFILDKVYANLPTPPFTPEEKEAGAAEVYTHVWQQAVRGEFAMAA